MSHGVEFESDWRKANGRIRTFNCWIVFVDKVALDQLDGQARFAYATTANHDQFVFSEKL